MFEKKSKTFFKTFSPKKLFIFLSTVMTLSIIAAFTLRSLLMPITLSEIFLLVTTNKSSCKNCKTYYSSVAYTREVICCS